MMGRDYRDWHSHSLYSVLSEFEIMWWFLLVTPVPENKIINKTDNTNISNTGKASQDTLYKPAALAALPSPGESPT